MRWLRNSVVMLVTLSGLMMFAGGCGFDERHDPYWHEGWHRGHDWGGGHDRDEHHDRR
jgi:hypothetical protein